MINNTMMLQTNLEYYFHKIWHQKVFLTLTPLIEHNKLRNKKTLIRIQLTHFNISINAENESAFVRLGNFSAKIQVGIISYPISNTEKVIRVSLWHTHYSECARLKTKIKANPDTLTETLRLTVITRQFNKAIFACKEHLKNIRRLPEGQPPKGCYANPSI